MARCSLSSPLLATLGEFGTGLHSKAEEQRVTANGAANIAKDSAKRWRFVDAEHSEPSKSMSGDRIHELVS
ncbi:hypothetical protein [Sporisorium scitamineum]|uniref:Uncharacterized protein n=1 Tax=Sporisorium scitamineum TaxID=49012 RepID=A0A0F7RWF3_9BASI|nr:hypothetical protein [Sporisorium scitamineum]